MLELLISNLAEQDWFVWHLGQTTRGQWRCQLYTTRRHAAVQNRHNRDMGGYAGGFSVTGEGDSAEAAVRGAAAEILVEQVIDLAAILA